MKLWNKKNDKETRRLPMGRKSKRAFAAYAAVVLMACCFTTTAFAASAAVWADDDVVKDPIDTPQAVSRWYNAKAMQFLPNGGPEGKPAVKLVSTDVKKGVGCELQLDIEKIRGKLVEVTAEIKG